VAVGQGAYSPIRQRWNAKNGGLLNGKSTSRAINQLFNLDVTPTAMSDQAMLVTTETSLAPPPTTPKRQAAPIPTNAPERPPQL